VRLPLALLQDIDAEFAAPGRVYLFESRCGRPFTWQYVAREIGRAARRVLGKRIGAHVLRHSRATDLYQSTKRIKAVSVLLGHAGMDTPARYYVRDDFSDAELFNDEAL
jgi:integrase